MVVFCVRLRFLLGRKPVKRMIKDLLLLAAFFSAGKKAIKASYFDRGLILSVKHRHIWMNWFNILAKMNKIAHKISCLRPITIFRAVIDFILTVLVRCMDLLYM